VRHEPPDMALYTRDPALRRERSARRSKSGACAGARPDSESCGALPKDNPQPRAVRAVDLAGAGALAIRIGIQFDRHFVLAFGDAFRHFPCRSV